MQSSAVTKRPQLVDKLKNGMPCYSGHSVLRFELFCFRSADHQYIAGTVSDNMQRYAAH